MRIYDFGENADEGKWTFRRENLTWGTLNSKWGKMGDHLQLLTELINLHITLRNEVVVYYKNL